MHLNVKCVKVLHILKQFLHILKVAVKLKQMKTRFQFAERGQFRTMKCKVETLIKW